MRIDGDIVVKVSDEVYVYNDNKLLGLLKIYKALNDLSDYRIYTIDEKNILKKDWFYGY